MEFDQSEFHAPKVCTGLADIAYVYIPSSCQTKSKYFSIHVTVAINIIYLQCIVGYILLYMAVGCPGLLYLPPLCGSNRLFSNFCREQIGRNFVEHAGYNHVAEKNNIIVLYPQTTPIDLPIEHFPWMTGGCFDL
jgi:hypothetical protein